jgi:hypothetical protein
MAHMASLSRTLVFLRVLLRRLSSCHGKTRRWKRLSPTSYIGLPHKQALLLNRIQNIIVPSRRPPRHHTRSNPNSWTRWALLRLVLPSVFPVDLSSPTPGRFSGCRLCDTFSKHLSFVQSCSCKRPTTSLLPHGSRFKYWMSGPLTRKWTRFIGLHFGLYARRYVLAH